MRLEVAEAQAFGGGQTGERADLVDQHRLQFLGRDAHWAAAEALQVGIGDMRADADAAFLRQPQRAPHHQRIAGMEAAGDVGRGDDAEQFRVGAHGPGAEALAQVGIEIDLHGSSEYSAPLIRLAEYSAASSTSPAGTQGAIPSIQAASRACCARSVAAASSRPT